MAGEGVRDHDAAQAVTDEVQRAGAGQGGEEGGEGVGVRQEPAAHRRIGPRQRREAGAGEAAAQEGEDHRVHPQAMHEHDGFPAPVSRGRGRRGPHAAVVNTVSTPV